MSVYSIGFTRKSAREFFYILASREIGLLVDVRLSNSSQLSGFAKAGDLEYFLGELCGAGYRYEPSLSPTRELFEAYRKKQIGWCRFESSYLELLGERRVENTLDRSIIEGPSVFLCSEASPERCHRRLALEYLLDKWGGFEIVHL